MRTKQFFLFCSAALSVVAILQSSSGLAYAQSHRIVTTAAAQYAAGPPLREIRPIPPKPPHHSRVEDDDREATRRIHPATPVQDAAIQYASTTPLSTNSGLNILGLGTGFPGYNLQANVPDTNGAVGPTQFIQFVNESFVILNKSNGSVAYGPAANNTLWSALGGACAANPNLDSVAEFDKLANRWVLMMPVFGGSPYLCFAVSTTSDAVNGSWHLYAFQPPTSRLCGCRLGPDYPKLAVWPDGYYLTYNQGYEGQFEGAAACVVDRSNMLNGNPATMQCVMNTPATYGALLAADVDGATPPPTGSPEYFVNFDSNDTSLDIWKFAVNWTTPGSSTFTGPTNIPVSAFTEACGEGQTELNYTTGACIPQKGTAQTLDSYGDRLMYRLAYRNFGSYQSLVANHTVMTNGSGSNTGIRWYELRNSGSGFGVYQQGTYAPDSNYRWMGSIAMDKAGDIALGYSVSSSSMTPSIRYTGRQSGDALGQMRTEVDVLAQANVANTYRSGSIRWGDYSSLAVDPSDDCTFWYTTEYMPANGGNRWSTRIASFSFPSCTAASAPWTLLHKASALVSPGTGLTVPSTGSGNLIVVAVMNNGSTSVSGISDNAGNSYVSAGARSTTGTFSTDIWYALNSNSGATVITPAFGGSVSHIEMTSWEVSGFPNAVPDAINTSSGSAITNTPGPAVTTTQSGDFIVSVLFASASAFNRISTGNEFTNDFNTNGNGWARITSNSAAAGTHQASWYSASPTGSYCASTVAFRP